MSQTDKTLHILIGAFVVLTMFAYIGMKSCKCDARYLYGPAAQAAVAQICFDEFASTLIDSRDARTKQVHLYEAHDENERRSLFIAMLMQASRGYFRNSKLKFDYIAPCMEKFLEARYGK